MKKSLLIALALTTTAWAGNYEAPNVKVPKSPDSTKIETKSADWQDMNDTKISHDDAPVRQLASDPTDDAVNPKDRGPSSNVTDTKTPSNPDADSEKNHQEKLEFWKYEKSMHPRGDR